MIAPGRAHELAPTGLYDRLPAVLRGWLEDRYYRRVYGGTKAELRRTFAETFFESPAELDRLRDEFHELGGTETIERARERHAELTDGAEMAELPVETTSTYYALIRSIEPEVLVETGVCNGVSTYGLLLALRENGHGHLISVDYPVRQGEADADHAPSADHLGQAVLPEGHDPGWFIPEELREHWRLELGLSQAVLPELRAEVDAIDFFVHDSGHSLPCMMFEFELAWNWLDPGGVLFTDDVLWDGHDAFARFVSERCGDATWGYAGPNTGYVVR